MTKDNNKNKQPEKGQIREIDWSNHDRGKAQNNGNDIKKGIDFEKRPQSPPKPKNDNK